MKKQTTNIEQISERVKAFERALTLITEDKVKQFCVTLLDNADDYFFIEPASSTGKHHPSYANGEGGLMRHSIAVAMILNELLATDMFKFSEHNKNLLICAAIVHDIKKQGNDSKGFTVKNHPECAVEYVKNIALLAPYLPSKDVEYICEAVVTHMGKWGSEKPKNNAQKLLHMADCLASRKFLTVEFEDKAPVTNNLVKEPIIPCSEYEIPFGKHKGLKLSEAPVSYVRWIAEDYPRKSHPAVKQAKKYLKEIKS